MVTLYGMDVVMQMVSVLVVSTVVVMLMSNVLVSVSVSV